MAMVQRAETAEAFAPRIVGRADVNIDTQITVANRPRSITLINISSHGFMGECRAGVPLKSRVSLDLPGLDIAALARGYGCAAQEAATPADARDALREALGRTGPTVIVAPISDEVPPLL